MEIRKISLEFPESAELFSSYAINEKILFSMAKSGELDDFWKKADGEIFEPSLKSYYEIKPAVAISKPNYEKDFYDEVYDQFNDFPKGDCQTLWLEFRRARCWTRQALIESTKMDQRNSFCSKIQPGSSQYRCFDYANSIGDIDIRKHLIERGRTDVK